MGSLVVAAGTGARLIGLVSRRNSGPERRPEVKDTIGVRRDVKGPEITVGGHLLIDLPRIRRIRTSGYRDEFFYGGIAYVAQYGRLGLGFVVTLVGLLAGGGGRSRNVVRRL